MPKTKATDTPDSTDAASSGEDFRADLAPTSPPQFDAATDDPAHPLHHHAKRDALVSPEPAKE
jgi:hypothetical protein